VSRAPSERLSEYCTAVANGETESRAPGPQGSSVPSFQEAAAQPWLNGEAGATNNNYSRSEGQVRGRGEALRLSASLFPHAARPRLHRRPEPGQLHGAWLLRSCAGGGDTWRSPSLAVARPLLGSFLSLALASQTGRNTSRVLAPPGGASSLSFGDDTAAPSRQRFATPETYVAGSAAAAAAVTAARNNASNVGFGSNAADPGTQANNYARGDGQVRFARCRIPATAASHPRMPVQNVGNFMSGRNSSRVTHAPGGASSIVFGQ
jgi:hypothetical protein